MDVDGELAIARVKQRLFDTAIDGVTIGRFRLGRRLGAGGMGVVYEALDAQLGRRVALKLLRTDPDQRDEDERARLIREGRALARMSHPNVISVFDVGVADERVYVAMELVRGPTVRHYLALERRPWREIVALFVEVGRGLAAAHAVGLVHRDFKPDNAMIGEDGRARVLDFGLARPLAANDRDPTPRSSDADLERVTQTGKLVGTPAYMAPEQIERGIADARSDQFAFCVALFEALCGRRPYNGTSPAQILSAIRIGTLRWTSGNDRLPRWLRKAVSRGLAGEPSGRHATMGRLLGALERGLARRGRGGVVVVAATLALIGTALLPNMDDDCPPVEDMLANVWDPARREAMRSAFLASGTPDADAAWMRASARIDTFVKSWSRSRDEFCVAPRASGTDEESVARERCLERRLHELRALLASFASADAAVVREATRASHLLTAPEACASAHPGDGAPMPADPFERMRVEELRVRLVHVEGLITTAQYELAAVQAAEGAEAARRIGWTPTLAEALRVQGVVLARLGERGRAAATLEEAVWTALAAGSDAIAAAAANELIHLVGFELERHEDGHRWNRVAAAAIARLADAPALEADRLKSLGNVLAAEGRYEEAQAHYERALDSTTRAWGEHHPEAATVLANLGSALQIRGDPTGALERFGRAREIAEETMGPEHPETARILVQIGNVHQASKDHATAAAFYEDGLAVYERAFGPGHGDIAKVLMNLGVSRMGQGRYPEALANLERARVVAAAALPRDHPLHAQILHNTGVLFLVQDRDDEALLSFRAALELKVDVLGADHPAVGTSLRKLGESLARVGRLDDGRAQYQRALELYAQKLGVTHVDHRATLREWARVELDHGDPCLARSLAERALDVATSAGAPAEVELARALTTAAAER